MTSKQDDSSTKVHFSKKGAYRYMSGIRKPISIRIDTGLYKHFKQVAKAVYGSVCRPQEMYMIATIEAVENGVHFSNTDKPINIEKIVIQRNLRPRRKLEIEGEDPFCGFNGCNGVAVGSGVYRETRPYQLCANHLVEAKANSKDWKVLG